MISVATRACLSELCGWDRADEGTKCINQDEEGHALDYLPILFRLL